MVDRQAFQVNSGKVVTVNLKSFLQNNTIKVNVDYSVLVKSSNSVVLVDGDDIFASSSTASGSLYRSPTPTPTRTITPTPTQTRTPTASVTVTPTQTQTATPSATAAVSPTPVESATPTPTVSTTVSGTPSASVTPTPTVSTTASVTPDVTVTPTPEVSSTPAVTTTVTPTVTTTVTPSTTVSVTPSPTVSATMGVSVTPSATVTPTPSVSESVGVTQTPVVTSSPTPTVTASSTPTPTASSGVTVTPTGTPVASATPTPTISATVTATVTATPTASNASVTPSATPTPTVTPSTVAAGTPDGPEAALISPAVVSRMSTYSSPTKIGSIQPAPAWMTSGNGIYWGDQVKASSPSFPDRRFNYFSTDHAEGTGGIGITVCVGDPSVLTNWKVYDDAVDAGWLADIPNLPAKGGPIFTGFGGEGNQYETPCVNKVGGEFLMTYQATNVPGARNQATLIAVSPNGVSNWTGTHSPLMQVPASEIIGDGHHGYMKWGPNPFPRSNVPYDYVAYSLVGGQSRSTQAMWGSNAPKTTWVFLGGIGKISGRATPSNRFATNSDRYKLAGTAIDVKSFRQTRQGYAAMGEFAGVGSGATARPGEMYEFLFAADGKTIIGRPQLVIPRGAAGSIDNGEAATGSVLTFGNKSIIIYNAANSSNAKVSALAVSPLGNAMNTWFNTQSPAIPPASKITTKTFDFKGASALPAGLTAVSAGTTLPTPSFSTDGLSVTVDGTMATKGEYHVFEDEGFDPLTTEYVDIMIDGWSTTSSAAYRHPYIGFSTTKSLRASFTDALFVGTGETTTATMGYQAIAAGAQPVTAGTSEDYWGVGYGTSAFGTMAFPKKMVGVRIYPKDNIAYILGEGGVEQQEFKVSGSSMMTAFDKTKRWYPFFGFLGTEVSAATERVARMTVNVSAPTRATDAATLGTVATNQTSANVNAPTNFGAVAIGTAAADRVVAFYISGRTTGDMSLTASFTPDSGAAIPLTLVKLHKSTYDAPNVTFMALFVGAIPTGTSGTIAPVATGPTVVRWGCKAVPMYGVQTLPADVIDGSLAGFGSVIDLGINKFEGGITSLATIHSTSGATLHSHAAEEVLFDSVSQEIHIYPQSNAAYQVIGVRGVSASAVSMENTNSGGHATIIASWKKVSSPTVTPTVTPTVSATPSVTPTISVTPTGTPVVTPTVTSSATPTSSTTPTVSSSGTPTVTPTSTGTPTVTSSTTPTVTSTGTPVVTPTSTPTVGVSSTPAVTPTSTPTSTAVAASATPTVTPTSSTVAASPTPTVTPTSTVVSATPTGTPPVTTTITPTVTSTATPTITATATPTSTVAAASPTPTPTVTITSSANTNLSPQMFAVRNAAISNTQDTRAYSNVAQRWQYFTGSGDLAEISVVFNNWSMNATTNSILNPGNDTPIQACSIEINGVTAPVTFSGSRTRTLLNGEDDVVSDAIPASAFGLSSIPRGSTVFIKFIFAMGAPNRNMPISNFRQTSDGGYCIWYDPASVTVSSVDSPGAFTVTGAVNNTNSVVRPFAFMPRIVGRYLPGYAPVWVAVGDSITQGLNDTSANRIGGRGWIGRMLADSDGDSNGLSYCNMGVASALSITSTNSPRFWSAYKYATHGTFMHGTNDFDTSGTGVTVATMQTRATNGINQMRTAPGSRITTIMVGKIIVRTTSTDGWKTTANQTYRGTGWAPGANIDQFNAWLDTQNGVLFNALIPWTFPRDSSIPQMWGNDGGVTNNYMTADGTHPTATAYIGMANEARSARLALPA
ncbi:hypothetical protein Xoosp13_179 [Xanthomonas phage Xoo-sp13]|nr:hypothetical protein Xoosp13_179 [Xanthomonas phage Xoo-sp13]